MGFRMVPNTVCLAFAYHFYGLLLLLHLDRHGRLGQLPEFRGVRHPVHGGPLHIVGIWRRRNGRNFTRIHSESFLVTLHNFQNRYWSHYLQITLLVCPRHDRPKWWYFEHQKKKKNCELFISENRMVPPRGVYTIVKHGQCTSWLSKIQQQRAANEKKFCYSNFFFSVFEFTRYWYSSTGFESSSLLAIGIEKQLYEIGPWCSDAVIFEQNYTRLCRLYTFTSICLADHLKRTCSVM